MKKLIHLGVIFIICLCSFTNAFSGMFGYGSVEFVYKDMIIINSPNDQGQYTMTMEDNAMLELITGERVPIRSHNLKKGTVIEFMAYGIELRLVSAKIVYGGENAEYIEIGSLGSIVTNQDYFSVNKKHFLPNTNTFFHSNGKEINPQILKRTDLVKVSYYVDYIDFQNKVVDVELLHGSTKSVKRTNVILSLDKNVLKIGDPIDTLLQERFIVTDDTKVYNKDFILTSSDSLRKDLLVDIHSWYDTTTSTFFAYEIHIIEPPTENEFNIINSPIDLGNFSYLTEFGDILYHSLPIYRNVFGENIVIYDLVYMKSKNFSSHIIRDTSEQWMYSLKEMSTTPKECTYDAVISSDNLVPFTNGFYTAAVFNSVQTTKHIVEINKAKSQLQGVTYENVTNKKVRITTRKGSNVNNNATAVSEVIGVEVLQENEPSVIIGLISHTIDSNFTINSINITKTSNTRIVNSNTNENQDSMLSEGNFVVVVLDSSNKTQATTIYKFYSSEIIGRMSYLDDNTITVSGLTFPISDKTFFRGKGNQVITKDKIEKNSIVLAVTYFGPTEAYQYISKDLFKNSSNPTESFVRFVYHIYGPNPVSVNENFAQSVLIFPNPSSTTVSISSPENIVSEITIYTMLGEKVFSKTYVTGITQFSTATLPIGQYIVKISNNKSTTNQILQVIR